MALARHATSFGAIQAVTTIVLKRRQRVFPAPVARLCQQGNGYRSNRPGSGLRRAPRRHRLRR